MVSTDQPRSLLVASRNPEKVVEIRHHLAALDLTIRDLGEFPNLPEVAETGSSFAENALLKARATCARTGMLTLADDSGLEVAALDGAPGIRSARFAGPGATDAERIAHLLKALDGVPQERRSARFTCAVALVGPNGDEVTFTGSCHGRILTHPVGEGGFGYDPIFQVPALGKTFAQLSRDQKSSVSHRGRALDQLRDYLFQRLGRRR